MKKQITALEAAQLVKEGDTVGFSGFLGVGEPLKLMEALIEVGTKDLTAVSVVTSYPHAEFSYENLFKSRQIKHMIIAHIGTSKEFQRQYNAGEITAELNPMGTLVERLYAAGAGLGCVMTPTGVGTILENTVEKVERNGKEYLLYDPLPVDVAFIKGTKADRNGNIFIKGTIKNISPQLALAGKLVIVEVDEIVEVGELDPEMITISEILVDHIVQGYTTDQHQQVFGDLWEQTGQLRKEEA